jgi:hypothetical protein
MQTFTRRIFGSSAASTNALSSIDVTTDSILVALALTIQPLAFVNSDALDAELSAASVYQGITNDALSIIANLPYSYGIATQGAVQGSTCLVVSPMQLFIPRGTRIYLHTLQVGTSTTRIRATLHFMLK